MTQLPACPKCNSPYTYPDGTFLICSECAHEWTDQDKNPADSNAMGVVKDAYGTVLSDSDTITVIKDLKIKGSSQVVKVGTKVKNIRLLPGEDHNIDCKIEGIGAMKLKSEFVKKV
ncbi:MAG: alkylphosphonate utilization protein [Legionella sp.]|nr:MAG: alkylphosphonate utilization protein [Legionella sp.]